MNKQNQTPLISGLDNSDAIELLVGRAASRGMVGAVVRVHLVASVVSGCFVRAGAGSLRR